MSYHPTKNDQRYLDRTIREIKGALYQFLGEYQDLILVGSASKGTWLVGDTDIDIYVCHKKLSEEKVWNNLPQIFPEGHVKEGQLKIWNLSCNGFDVDLVLPCKGKREDTILHSDWYNRHLTDFMRGEIRTAKAYFKTKGVYGAEIGGIVGVAIEQLVLLQGNFRAVCMLFTEMRPSVQDPTMQTERDLLACVNRRRWKQIQKACVEYLDNPTFEYKPLTWQEFMHKYPKHCTIQFQRTHDKATDYQTVYSIGQKIKRMLRNKEPDVEIDLDVWVGEKVIMCYRVRPLELTPQRESCIDSKGDAVKFKEAHPEAYEKNGLVCAMVDRHIIFPDTYFYYEVVKGVEARKIKQI